MTRLWVVGAGGLLGSAIRRRARAAGLEVRAAAVPWADASGAVAALDEASERFLRGIEEPWVVAWCAGVGTVASGSDELATELAVFEGFLERLTARVVDPDVAGRGVVFLASSAGGVYAGSSSPPFTEATEPRPLSPYGETKLAMELRLAGFSARTAVASMIGRITNLYGPGQDLAKPQGLISHLCRTQVRGLPLSVYVPLDTRRDYLFVDDAAAMIVRGLVGLGDRLAGGPERSITKIFASHRSTTVAELLGEFRRIAKRRPLLALASSADARQPLDLRVRSVVWNELDALATTPLPVGLRATRDDIAAQLIRGRDSPRSRSAS